MSVVRSVRAVVVLALFGACGCAGPRFVSIGPEGGSVALPANTPYYHNEAVKMLDEKYPHGYVIDHEGEVVVGQVTTEHTTGSSIPFVAAVQHSTEVDNKMEWQIAFHPKGVQPAAPVAQAPPPVIQQTSYVPPPPPPPDMHMLPKEPVPVGQ